MSKALDTATDEPTTVAINRESLATLLDHARGRLDEFDREGGYTADLEEAAAVAEDALNGRQTDPVPIDRLMLATLADEAGDYLGTAPAGPYTQSVADAEIDARRVLEFGGGDD